MENITFAVVRNGAVWKCHEDEARALAHAGSVAHGTDLFENFQGFDEHNKSAVVTRPVRVTVERLVDNKTDAVIARWIAGNREL